MQAHDVDFCTFREVKAVVVTWNAGASMPATLRNDERSVNFLREIFQINDPPDILVFSFQELVDLEDKRLTASRVHFHWNVKRKDSNIDQEAFSKEARRKTPLSRNI